jgi:DNA-binding MarR family transcriptional regulator
MKAPMDSSLAELAAWHDRLPYLIGAVSNVLAAGASRLYRKEFGIGLSETRLMWVMTHETGLTVQRASRIMGVDKGATSRALASLVRRGLVDVEVDTADNRRRIMVFSETGGKLRDQITNLSVERERRINAIFSADELAMLRHLLNRLLAHARDVGGPRSRG